MEPFFVLPLIIQRTAETTHPGHAGAAQGTAHSTLSVVHKTPFCGRDSGLFFFVRAVAGPRGSPSARGALQCCCSLQGQTQIGLGGTVSEEGDDASPSRPCGQAQTSDRSLGHLLQSPPKPKELLFYEHGEH